MKTNVINRRFFLSKSSIGLVGTGTGLFSSEIISAKPHSTANLEPGRIKDYRVLGRTGFKVSDIGCGTMGISNENVLKEIIASGVNLIDTGEAYAPVPEGNKKLYDRIIEKQKKAESFLQKNNLSNGNTKREAAIGFALNNPSVHSVLITFKNFEDVDNYVRLSGTRLTGETITLINSLKETLSHLYCRHACGLCEGKCPVHIQVNRIMRYNHYFMAQAREKYAIQKYNDLAGPKAENCFGCEGFCEAACPFGVPIHLLLAVAHSNLNIDSF